uniref:Uncharacterized protein n=1 Tax=viral metagenome TaxID=1070528 RepID=A0A6M3LDW5_9ZZZZ
MGHNEEERLILLLVKQDFPDMGISELTNISPHQRRGYLCQVTRFLFLTKLFGYKILNNYDNPHGKV